MKEVHHRQKKKQEQQRQEGSNPDLLLPSFDGEKHDDDDAIGEKENDNNLVSELQRMKEQMMEQEGKMDDKVSRLNQELRKQTSELRNMTEQEKTLKTMEAESDIKFHKYVSHLAKDLESYKGECTSYRERVLEKEREVGHIEQLLYEEKKKVVSLESENLMLLNIADDNASIISKTERTSQAELVAYREECQTYRQRVLDLERKVLTAEGAMESTGQIVTAIEDDKKFISEQLEESTANNCKLEENNKSLQTQLEDKDAELKAQQDELETLKTEWTKEKANIDEAKEKVDTDMKTVSLLESENATLLQQLDSVNASLATLQSTADRYTQIEDENKTLKKRNDELETKHIELSKDANNAQVQSSNTERLHKMMSDNEQYIAKLQEELSTARTSHFETLQETRSKHSVEINDLMDKLQSVKESSIKLEARNTELEDKFISMDRAYAELENVGLEQTKSQSDQVLKLMEHCDELRKKASDCETEHASMKHELSERIRTHDRLVQDLQHKVELLEGTKSDFTDRLTSTNTELGQLRDIKLREEYDLKQIIQEKDDALFKFQHNLVECSAEKIKDTDSLKNTIQQLQHDLDDATTSRDRLNMQLVELQQQFMGAANTMRDEKTTLLSDIQTQIVQEKQELMKQVEGIVSSYKTKLETLKLGQTMNHSVAMSTVYSEKRDTERILYAEREASIDLRRSLDQVKIENHELSTILKTVCERLSVDKGEALIDAVDDILVDRSEARVLAKTLEVDVTALTVDNNNLKHINDTLSSQLMKIESDLEKDREVSASMNQVVVGVHNMISSYLKLLLFSPP